MNARALVLMSLVCLGCDRGETEKAVASTATPARPGTDEAPAAPAEHADPRPSPPATPQPKGPMPEQPTTPSAQASERPSIPKGPAVPRPKGSEPPPTDDPFLADPPTHPGPLKDASLSELIRRANAIAGTMADTFGQDTNLLPTDAEKRAVLLLVLAPADDDHAVFLSLVPEAGIDTGPGVFGDQGLALVDAKAKHLSREAVKQALETPGYLGLMPAKVTDSTKTQWTLERTDDGVINVGSVDSTTVAQLSADPDGTVWLRALISSDEL